MSAIVEPTEADIDALSAKLKCCPFCGSPSRVTWTGVPDFRRGAPRNAIDSIAWQVECTSVGSRCPMGKHWLCSTSGGVVDAWNRRFNANPPFGVNTTDHVADIRDPCRDARNSEEPR